MEGLSSQFNKSTEKDFTIFVKTGDHQGAVTNVNIYVILVNSLGKQSNEIHLHQLFITGSTNEFPATHLYNFGDVTDIKLRRTKHPNSKLYVEWIKVQAKDNTEFVFPINRWIMPGFQVKFQEYDSVLPQFDRFPDQRKAEIKEKKKTYAFAPPYEGLPCQVKTFPDAEHFSFMYDLGLGGRYVIDNVNAKVINAHSPRWESLDDIGNIYKGSYRIPDGMRHWKSDFHFGKQRLTGCNPGIIKLCTYIPENFAVTNEMISPIMEGMTIESAIKNKKLFIVDLKILKDLEITDSSKKVCSPIALFYLNGDSKLLPIAIQLFQDKADDNPVFLPTDDKYTWLFAKMWYNNADASFHQSASHLGMTHLLIESIVVATQTCLSPSHPLFRLMAPHSLYLIAINDHAREHLVKKDTWVDKTMAIGRLGMFEIVRRRFKTWRLDIDGTLPKELESRGLLDPDVLPNYYYRDDGLLLWYEIEKYVASVVHKCYDTSEKIMNDHELQEWHNTLSSPVSEGGCNIQGVPGDVSFKTKEEITQTVTSMIFTSSAMHAAVNFGQYDHYGFPPSYPATIHADPPKNKDPMTEKDVLEALPDKKSTFDVMQVTNLLSLKGTNGLGDFEVEYQFDPVGKEAVSQLRKALTSLGTTIDQRNNLRESEYTFLHPNEVPNAISI